MHCVGKTSRRVPLRHKQLFFSSRALLSSDHPVRCHFSSVQGCEPKRLTAATTELSAYTLIPKYDQIGGYVRGRIAHYLRMFDGKLVVSGPALIAGRSQQAEGCNVCVIILTYNCPHSFPFQGLTGTASTRASSFPAGRAPSTLSEIPRDRALSPTCSKRLVMDALEAAAISGASMNARSHPFLCFCLAFLLRYSSSTR